MTNDALKMPDEIYLLHNEGDMGEHLWCENIPNDEMEFTKYIRADRAALAPVDVDAGLRALDYQRDLALIFLVAKGSKDYDETIGDRIERVQELILQLKKQNDHLAARGCFVPEGYALVPIEPTDKILNAMAEQCDGYNKNYYFDIYEAMLKAASKKGGM